MTETRALSEFDAKRLLADHGLVVSREELVASPAEAVAAASRIGFPVVVKLCGTAFTHKTEIGGVRLELKDPASVESAAVELLDGVVDAAAAQLLVAEQVEGRRELIAGMATDPQFGPTLMLGVGGVLAEALADVTFRLLPIEDRALAAMLDDLACQPLLGELRGEPAVDRDAVAAALRAIARCAAADTAIDSIDVNPLVIRDGAPVAVDALVVMR